MKLVKKKLNLQNSRHLYICLACLFLYVISGQFVEVSGQFVPTEVKRSTNIVIENGQKYFMHEVKAKQTLYSISKAYGVTQKIIGQLNPFVSIGSIQPGQVLKIPYVEITEINSDSPKDFENYIYHIVEPKETLYALSRKYKVNVELIVQNNPGIQSGLSIGHEIRIPKTQIQPAREVLSTEIRDTGLIYHKVMPKETLFSLSRLYGIKVKDIKNANPDLRWGLSVGETLLIPTKYISNRELIPEQQDPDVLVTENPISIVETSVSGDCTDKVKAHDDVHFKVAILLPLFVNTNDTLHFSDTVFFPTNDMYSQALRYLEFYEGAMMAIDSLQQSGLNMTAYVYDTEQNPYVVRKLIEDGALNDVDLIIGPIYPETIEVVSLFSRIKRIPMVSPLGTKGTGLDNNPYLFQVNTTETIQHELVSTYISRFYDKNILLIKDSTDNTPRINSYGNRIFNYLTYKIHPDDLRYRQIIFTNQNRSVQKEDTLAFRLEDVLSLSRENLIIIPSTDKIFVTDIINRLNNLSVHYDITVFGMPQWGRFSEILQLESLFNLNLHYHTNFANPYVNYSDSLTLDFCRSYRDIWNNEPTRFSFQGFDVTYYFIKALFWFGKDLTRDVDCWNSILTHPTLQTSFYFMRNEGSTGFENQALSIVCYNKQTFVKEKISSTDSEQATHH